MVIGNIAYVLGNDIMRKQTALFTGHRTIPSAVLPMLTQRLDETISDLVAQGVSVFVNGGAIGFDYLAAAAVLKLRETNHDVKLVIIQPCHDQDARWKLEDQLAYRRLLNAADRTVCLSESYFQGCMEARNKMMVEISGVCVAYFTRGRTGTAQTIRLACEQGLTVINLAEA